MARILVAGGAGFIGSHLVDYLLSRGHSVRALDNLRNGSLDRVSEAAESENFEFVRGDILDMAACDSAVAGCDAVFHLACLGVRHSLHSPLENHEVNARGTLNLLDACRRKNPTVTFIYTSTSEVYGKVASFPIRESALPVPITVYGSSKLVGEHYCNSYRECFGLNTSVARVFNNYGPRSHYEGDSGEIIPRAIVRILQGQRPIVFGDGLVTRDFFYVKDTAVALTEFMDTPGMHGQTLNIGTGLEMTMKSVVEAVLAAMGKGNSEIQWEDARPADVPRLWIDPSLWRTLAAARDYTDFASGLAETVTYFRGLASQGKLTSVPVKNWQKGIL